MGNLLLLYIYSVCGWVLEILFMLLLSGTYCERGFLYGPYCPIYGFGLMGLSFLWKRYSKRPVMFIFLSMAVCGVIEYATSLIMELIFHRVWWDYSVFLFNCQGRVCLETLIPFGILSFLMLKYVHPRLVNLIKKIPTGVLWGLNICIIAGVFADFIATLKHLLG